MCEWTDWRESQFVDGLHIGQFEGMMSGCIDAAAFANWFLVDRLERLWRSWRLSLLWGGFFGGLDFLGAAERMRKSRYWHVMMR
jgi:hypothetical protein